LIQLHPALQDWVNPYWRPQGAQIVADDLLLRPFAQVGQSGAVEPRISFLRKVAAALDSRVVIRIEPIQDGGKTTGP